MKKHQGQYRMNIIELKERAARLHKSSITFWAKAILIVVSLNCFYYQASLKLIDFFKSMSTGIFRGSSELRAGEVLRTHVGTHKRNKMVQTIFS